MNKDRLDHLESYYGAFPKDQDCRDMLAIIGAIKDKMEGLGLLWETTDFEGIKKRLSKFPPSTVIGQDIKAMLDWLERQKND